jgi:LCP family protein required for cell wall assembly
MASDDARRANARSRGSVPNYDRLAALGDAVDGRTTSSSPRRASRPRSKRRRAMRRTLIGVGVVVILIVGAIAGDYFYLGSLINHQTIKGLQSSAGNENILLIGSTSRCALKVQNKAYGLCSQGVTGVNSDIDMVLHLNLATKQVSLLSIPRDLFIPNARTIGANKIDAALYDGPSQLVAAIEEDFGIPINHYVELNFDTFAAVVNALGGVYMYFPTPIYDAESGLNIERSGCYLLDGYHALQVVRARHLQIQPNPNNHNPATWPQEALSDLARIRRTHEFLRVLANEVRARGIGNPVTDQSILASVLPDLTVDNGFSESTMLHLAENFAHTSISSAPQFTYPVILVETGSYLYQGYYYGDVEFPLQPTGVDVVNKIFDVAPGENSFTGKPLPSPSSFAMSIENGTGVTNQAATVGAALGKFGFRVTSLGNVTPVGPVSETVVWYGGPRPPDNADWNSPALADAQQVLEHLQGPAILGYDPAMVTPGTMVTLQTGTGVTVNKPAAAPASSHKKKSAKKGGQTTTTTTIYDPSGVSTNNAFSAPSNDNMPLAPYDPRACTPVQIKTAIHR